MKKAEAIAAVGLVAVAVVANFGGQPRAYQSQHISTGQTCAVTVHGKGIVVLEGRVDCGGFIAPVVPGWDNAGYYLACMADVQAPVIDAEPWEVDTILWYSGLDLWDTQGEDCNVYLKGVPGFARPLTNDMGLRVRHQAILAAAP